MTGAETTARIDQIRRVGFYFGPAILAAVLANVTYGFNCGGRLLLGGIGAQTPMLTLAFLVGGAIVAWRLREPLGRLAAVLCVAHQIVVLCGALDGVRVPPGLTTVTLSVWALVWTASAAREGHVRSFMIAGASFLVIFLFVLGARHWSDVLLGTRSVMSGRLCSML